MRFSFQYTANVQKVLLGALFAVLSFGIITPTSAATFTDCGISFTSPWWQVKDPDGTVVATIDTNGNFDMKSPVVLQSTVPNISASTNSFILKDTSGNPKFLIGKGQSTFLGKVYRKVPTIAADVNDFLVKNSAGTVVAKFDKETGNVYVTGNVCGIPVEITTCTELQKIGNDPSYPTNEKYKIMNDIDCSATNTWNGGQGFVPMSSFTGILDGQGHTITGLYVNRSTGVSGGLFSTLSTGAVVKNLTLANPNITNAHTSTIYTGALAGLVQGATIDTVRVTGGSVTGNNFTGGLVGDLSASSSITNSYATGSVTGNNYTGGLVGYLSASSITNSYATGSVYATASMVGGLVGYLSASSITNSYATGSVSSAAAYVGGLLGYSDTGTISQSFSMGNVISNGSYTGGFVGYFMSGSITNSFATSSVNPALPNANTGGFIGSVKGSTIQNVYYSGIINNPGYTTTGFVGYSDSAVSSTFSSCYRDDTFQPSFTASQCANSNTDNMTKRNTYPSWDFTNIWAINEKSSYPYFIGSSLIPTAPVVISTCNDLKNIPSGSLLSYYIAYDIDCSGTSFNASRPVFGGRFFGGGFTISNLTVPNGLFGALNGASISNINFKNVNITATTSGGILAATANNSDISHVTVLSGSVSSSTISGGIVGSTINTNIQSVNITDLTLTGGTIGGGIVGENGLGSTIRDSVFSGNLTVTSGGIGGGIVGTNAGMLSNVTSTGNISVVNGGGLVGTNSVGSTVTGGIFSGNLTIASGGTGGGLVGNNAGNLTNSFTGGNIIAAGASVAGGVSGNNSGNITNSYSRSRITGSPSTLGGAVGINTGTVSDVFWNTEWTGISTSAAGTGKTSAEMVQQGTFSNWDFSNIWGITSNTTFPYLINNSLVRYYIPHNISTCTELQGMTPNAEYYLLSDIDCSATNTWNTGAGFLPIVEFNGVLDGQGRTITGLYIDRTTSYEGLFGSTAAGAKIQNITLSNVNIKNTSSTASYLGGVVGSAAAGTTFNNVHVTGGTISGLGYYTGGIAGVLGAGVGITNSSNTATVSGNNYAGGIAAMMEDGAIITDSNNAGIITGNAYVGGILGYAQTGSSITNNTNTGDIGTRNVSNYVGGIAGYTQTSVTIANNTNTGKIEGASNRNNIIGYQTP
ncbi:MAG: ZmpA/ZmpB/ZmpC family metallo-endopeptidase-related protein [Candidatus Peregrinibacteria bacterium]